MNLELEITDIYHDCCNADWDGYGASPVTPKATENAIRFVNNFPELFVDRTVYVTPENSGMIVIDIFNNNDTQMLSFNFGNDPECISLYVIPN
jgi:hypothetical protein